MFMKQTDNGRRGSKQPAFTGIALLMITTVAHGQSRPVTTGPGSAQTGPTGSSTPSDARAEPVEQGSADIAPPSRQQAALPVTTVATPPAPAPSRAMGAPTADLDDPTYRQPYRADPLPPPPEHEDLPPAPEVGDRRHLSLQGRVVVEAGGDDLFKLMSSSGDTSTITGGGGVTASLGLYYHPDAPWTLEATVGYKYQGESYSNGDARASANGSRDFRGRRASTSISLAVRPTRWDDRRRDRGFSR